MIVSFHEVYLFGEGSFIYVHADNIQLTHDERRLYLLWVLGD